MTTPPRAERKQHLTGTIYAVGTTDTKARELARLCAILRTGHDNVLLVNVGTQAGDGDGDVTAREVAGYHPDGAQAVLGLTDRGQAVTAMATAFARFLPTLPDIAGVIGLGGGGGTAIATAGMRALPYGIPKIMVSTMASGDTAPYVGISDIIMLPAVTDLAGLNSVNRVILHNAAHAMLGMVASPAPKTAAKPAIGLTMFGVTTPCVTAIVSALPDHDCLVFHATGTGGQTMEKLADSGLLTGFIDITTTEVADYLRWRPALHGRPVRRGRALWPAMGRVGWRAGHGEFRRAGNRAVAIQGPTFLSPQSASHADAHDARRKSRHRHLDCR
jgi:uncharacterized protein (UPF0261 family)